jgi:hypothetical protein
MTKNELPISEKVNSIKISLNMCLDQLEKSIQASMRGSFDYFEEKQYTCLSSSYFKLKKAISEIEILYFDLYCEERKEVNDSKLAKCSEKTLE